ncbi:TPA: restriction endonuclease [Vibrio parahaemolyticus]|nr:restriction endonuclease [Vibrio parahaemolyticus]
MYIEELKKLSSVQWEFFSEDILWNIGYEIIERPSEGPDGGVDFVVSRNGSKYIVSCKHFLNSNKSVGVPHEADISERILENECSGFIAFYSTQATTPLRTRFKKLMNSKLTPSGFDIIEFYLTDILDLIPQMPSHMLQKYFTEPYKISDHRYSSVTDFKLICLEEGCSKDLINKENINLSRIQLVMTNKGLDIQYGCKSCLSDFGESAVHYVELNVLNKLDGEFEVYWWEFTQVRFIEELLQMRDLVNLCSEEYKMPLAPDFYRNWAKLQSAIYQILVPPHWGTWINKENMLQF